MTTTTVKNNFIETLYSDIRIPLVPKNREEADSGLDADNKRIINSAFNYLDKDTLGILSLMPDTKIAAEKIIDIWGLSPTESTLIFDTFDISIVPKTSDFYEYALPNEASETVQNLFSFTKHKYFSHKLEDLVESINKAHLTLTSFGLQCLIYFNRYIEDTLDSHYLSTRRSLSEEWIPYIVDRKCTLCESFISARDTHGFMINDYFTNKYEIDNPQGSLNSFCSHYSSENFNKVSSAISSSLRKEGKNPGERIRIVSMNDFIPLLDISVLELHDIDEKKVFSQDISLEALEDTYMASPILRNAIVSLFLQETKNGINNNNAALEIPSQIREAILASPPIALSESILNSENPQYYSSLMLILAAKINPCFTKTEIKHLIQVGDYSVLASLLAVRKTHDLALAAISNEPYEATKILAMKKNGMNEKDGGKLVNSANPKVRAISACWSGLNLESALKLASDPDEFVRKSLANPHLSGPVDPLNLPVTLEYPLVARTLVNDPIFDVARMVFESVYSDPFSNGRAANSYSQAENSILNSSKNTSNTNKENSFKLENNKTEENNEIHGFSFQQKDLIAHIKTRKRLNELKKHVIANPKQYPLKDIDVLKFLTH